MNQREYPCEFCDTDKPLVKKHVTLPIQREGRWYIFENVPAQVCQNCGHRYFDGKLMLELEKRMTADPQDARPLEAWAIALPPRE